MRKVTEDVKSKIKNLKCIYFIFDVAENYIKWGKEKSLLNAWEWKMYVLSNS